MRPPTRAAISAAALLLLQLRPSRGSDDNRNRNGPLKLLRKPEREVGAVAQIHKNVTKFRRRTAEAKLPQDRKNATRLFRLRRKRKVNKKSCRADEGKKLSAPWTLHKRRKTSRTAYRMAILASLAYHDFRDGNATAIHDATSWSFSLDDDPPPDPYLVENDRHSSLRPPLLSWRETKHNRSSSKLALSPPWSGGEKKMKIQMRQIVAGIVARFRVSLCTTRYKVVRTVHAKLKISKPYSATNSTDVSSRQCKQKLLQKHEGGRKYNVEWVLNNWHEEDKAKMRWHDTDLIVASSGTSEIVLAFAGTASAADCMTSVQTLEPASHSGLFDQIAAGGNSTNSTIEGNIHRGFLNAYARVSKGKIRRLDRNSPGSASANLDEHFDRCIKQQTTSPPRDHSTAVATIDHPKKSRSVFAKMTEKRRRNHEKRRDAIRRRNKHVCHSHGNRLVDILRDVTTSSLEAGLTVHLVGHSLAGALATIHALDIAANFEETPSDKLHLWTFGAPEVADSLFFESLGERSPRVRNFFGDGERHHRYVTRSARDCKTDVVASITSRSLNRKAVRRIGGVRGDVVHAIEPEFLACDDVTGAELHELSSYLGGISSSDSRRRPLGTDFPSELRSWLGEAKGAEHEA